MYTHERTRYAKPCSPTKQGNKYIMVMVKINSNAILVEPMKSCKDAEMIRAYDAPLNQLNKRALSQRNMNSTTRFQKT